MSTMQIDRGVVEQAMGAMLNFDGDISDEMFESIRSLRAALAVRGVADCHPPLRAKPVQEPVSADPHTTTLRNLLQCCLSWEPDVCVLGTVTAHQAITALRAALAQQAEPAKRGRVLGGDAGG